MTTKKTTAATLTLDYHRTDCAAYHADRQVRPKTTADLVEELLAFVTERQWADEFNRYQGDDDRGCHDCNTVREYGEEARHALDCPRAALIERAEAYVRVECSLVEHK